jgi:predicted nucleotidyltransferase
VPQSKLVEEALERLSSTTGPRRAFPRGYELEFFTAGGQTAAVVSVPATRSNSFLKSDGSYLRRDEVHDRVARNGTSPIPKSGMIMPILGRTRIAKRQSAQKSLADALFTKTQQRVLRVLFGQPGRSFYASELIRQAKAGSGAAQRELARLEESGLVTTRRVGHQRHFQANPESPLFSELQAIILKTVGLAEPLRAALAPFSAGIRAAFVYGSVAKETDRSHSDIDLMVISESLTYGEVFGALEPVTRTLGRQINPTVYTPAEFTKRVREESAFVKRILEQPKTWVIGRDRDLPA